MTAPLSEAFRDQARACTNLGSPFMGRLFTLLADHWPTETQLAARCRAFSGDLGPANVSLPLRIGGGLHALKLMGDADLSALYPPNAPDDRTFAEGIRAALETHDTFLTDWVESPPQTNELRRSAALIPGIHLLVAQYRLPIHLSELGASGGLNLMWDRFALAGPGWQVGPDDAILTLHPDWEGPRPVPANPVVASRRGVDLRPLNPSDADDLLRLTAFLWPDQPERLSMTRAAAGAMPAQVDQDDAIDWLADRLAHAPDDHLHIVQNTVAWQYFPDAAQARGRDLFAAAGAEASTTRPLAWLQLETDGDRHGLGGAAITLQTWPGGEVRQLGRADFHGRWVRWQPD